MARLMRKWAIRLAIHATRTMSATDSGRATNHSAAEAHTSLPVQSLTTSQTALGSCAHAPVKVGTLVVAWAR